MKLPNMFKYTITAQSEHDTTIYELSRDGYDLVHLTAEHRRKYTSNIKESGLKKLLKRGRYRAHAVCLNQKIHLDVEMDERFLFIKSKHGVLRGDHSGRVFASTYRFDDEIEEYRLRLTPQHAIFEAQINNRSYLERLPVDEVIDLLRLSKDIKVSKTISRLPITMCMKGPLLFYADFNDTVLPF